MSGRQVKATRRDIRRAVGPSVVELVIEHEATLQSLRMRLAEAQEAHAATKKNLGTAFENQADLRRDLHNFTQRTFWQRLRWLVIGR